MAGCAADKCVDVNNIALFICAGPCGRAFHGKCVDIKNGPTIDRLRNPDSGIVYFCINCRKISFPALSAKVVSLQNQFLNFHKLVLNLYSGFNQLGDSFKNFPHLVETKNQSTFTSTSDIVIPVAIANQDKISTHDNTDTITQNPSHVMHKSLPKPKKHKGTNLNRHNTRHQAKLSSTSHIPATPVASSFASSNDLPLPGAAPVNGGLLSDTPIFNQGRLSVGHCSGDVEHIAPVNAESLNFSAIVLDDVLFEQPLAPSTSVPMPLPNPPLEHTPSPLSTVPKPQSIFISRFSPMTSPENIMDYLSLKGIDTKNISCRRINKRSKPVASFLLRVPPESSLKLLDPSFWPTGAFSKPFEVKNLRSKQPSTTVINTHNQKN